MYTVTILQENTNEWSSSQTQTNELFDFWKNNMVSASFK